jgi:flagellar motor switch protein FliN/FliY
MSTKLDGRESISALLDQFSTSFAQVMDSMAEQRPEIRWRAVSGPASSLLSVPTAEALWWQQPLQFAPGMTIWVAAPAALWEHCGSLVLKAAGLDSFERSESRNTWIEVLGQALSAVARAAGGVLGYEVSCESGVEAEAPASIDEWASFEISFPDKPPGAVLLAFSPKFIEALCVLPASPEEPQPETQTQQAAAPAFAERSRTLDLLLDVDLPVSISFGKTQLPLKDVIKLTTGSIVELNRGVNEPVEVLVNQTLVARGEVVVVDGNYGVRILEITSRVDRLRSLQ